MRVKTLIIAFLVLVLGGCRSYKASLSQSTDQTEDKVVVAYVTSWSKVMPDPKYMTHISSGAIKILPLLLEY